MRSTNAANSAPRRSTPAASPCTTAPRRSCRTRRISTTVPFPIIDRRGRLATAAALAVVATPLLAQDGGRIWRNTLYPYAYYSTSDGFWGVGHLSIYSPLGFVERPEPTRATIALEAAASTQGSYHLFADAELPAYWDGWRAAFTLYAGRDNRLGYYGQGNRTVYDADSTTAADPYFYRVSRTHQSARLTVQRRVVGPLRLLAGGMIEHIDFRTLPGTSLFARDLASGRIDSTTVPFTDYGARAGVVIDTRDHEVDPHRGIVFEGLYATGHGYHRTTVSARGFVHPLSRLVLAGRLAGERISAATSSSSPPVAPQMVMESSEQPAIAVGGYRSLRGYFDARFTGPGKLVGGLEARYALLYAPTVLEVKLVGFYDVGRVFDAGQTVRVTADGLHKAGGAELAIRFLRSTLVVVGWGRSVEGGQLLVGSTWSY